MSKKMYLGESLSTLSVLIRDPRPQDVIADLWEGGSVLSGIEICGMVLDRAPLLVKNPLTSVKAEFLSVKPATVFIGSESSYHLKVSKGMELQKNWLLELSKGGKIPRGCFCNIFKQLRSKVANKRIYDTISKIELSSKRLTLLRHGIMHYDKLVNSLPLPYVMSKISTGVGNGAALPQFDYVSLLIEIALTKLRLEEYTIIYVGKGDIVPHTVVLVPLTYLKESASDDVLVYSITSIKRPYTSHKGEYVGRLLSDLRKLGLQEAVFMGSRLICEKYGLLSNIGPELENVINSLKDHDVELLGRLGTWREMSIDDILDSTGIR